MSESISGTGLAGGILTGASVYGLLTCISSDLNWLHRGILHFLMSVNY